MSDFDALVIGSGAGGLTAALGLARAGQKVLVLEQHYVPGGWCHSFTLEGFHFSPGVHYIGELQDGGRMRQIYEGLGVAQDLAFFELPPGGFEHVRVGSETFDIPKGKDEYARRLSDRFPKDRAGIVQFLDIVERISGELNEGLRVKGPLDLLRLPFRMPTVIRHGLRNLSSVLGGLVSDPHARAILSMQAGDHGLPPERAPTAMHACIVGHYFHGGWYPKGGAFTLPRAFVRALERHGGSVRLETPVEEILIREGRAVGVRLKGGEEISARRIISNADPHVTFGKLVPESAQGRMLRAKLRRTTYSTSCLSLFLGVDMDVRAAGLDGGNYWWSRDADISAGYRDKASVEALARDEVPGMFLTCTTLKDPTKRKDRLHTLEAFTFVSHEAFAKWAKTEYGERPEDYAEMKRRLTERLIDASDRLVPGLKERVVFSDLGTPLSNVHYCRATGGGLYGTEKKLSQIGPFGWQPRTSIPGLYLCGASTVGHGVAGATISGLVVAGMILGESPMDLLTEKGQHLECYRSDDPSTWPEKLTKRVAAQAETRA